MQKSGANIEITKSGSVWSTISVIMPTWNKCEDGLLSVNIPLFGLKTIAKNENDAEIAIEEAIKCFCITAEKFGHGIEKELEALGWKVEKNDSTHSLLTYNIENVVFEQILQTGDQYAHTDIAIS